MGPHLCLNLSGRFFFRVFQTFVCNFSREILVGAGRNIFYTQHCIFSQGYLPVKMASTTVTIRFSALLPINATFQISAPFECGFVNKRPHSNIIQEYRYVSTKVHLPLIAHKRTVMPHYKNSGLMSI